MLYFLKIRTRTCRRPGVLLLTLNRFYTLFTCISTADVGQENGGWEYAMFLKFPYNCFM